MTQLFILGAGGHGAVVAEAAVLSKKWSAVVFLDDKVDNGTDVVGCLVVGDTTITKEQLGADGQYFVAIGDNNQRAAVLTSIEEQGATLAQVIHPNAVVSQSAIIERGTVICAGAVINARARIGSGSIINTCASIDHDCVLGQSVHVSPGAHLAGGVTVGDESWIGIGAVVRGGISIGSNCVIGAGSAVVADVESGKTVAGVPAKNIGNG